MKYSSDVNSFLRHVDLKVDFDVSEVYMLLRFLSVSNLTTLNISTMMMDVTCASDTRASATSTLCSNPIAESKAAIRRIVSNSPFLYQLMRSLELGTD
jgi:hypothetical protein